METIGVMTTGATFALGAVWLFGGFGGADATAPVAAAVTDAPVIAAPEVTRRASDMQSLAAIDRLASVVQQSQTAIERSETLSPEQLEVIKFFEATARKLNEKNDADPAAQVRLNDLAVVRLNVRYFYTIARPYAQLEPAAVLAGQQTHVLDTICNEPSIQELINTYGFTYTYTYISEDNRLIGRVQATKDSCI